MPQNNNPPPPVSASEVIDLEIDFDGTVVWNGTVVQSLNQLEGYFNEESQEGRATGDPPAADRRASTTTWRRCWPRRSATA